MYKLTEEDLCTTNYELFITEGTHLPKEVRDVLQGYIGVRVTNRRTGEQAIRFSIPSYLAKQWLEKYGER